MTKGRLAADILLYTLARLAIVVVVAAIIVGGGALVGVTVPLLVAAIFGVLIAMPVSMFVLGGMRRRLNAAIAGFDAQRRADREALHARLRGDSK
ncbi:DUF4229 domain-containing protein [Rhodococcus rhodnii]|uniref:DUF4229 domain-containing protein n=2 Tax=Rhodococcus rhodnii TaxID=38312 RepID=R7WPH2_9NOCA|nr:hypothetical protein Rrhod_1428 [Rhodococcus rhodnii LMG 5362]TXG92895.1 DUF4229 domain-containing protein [Rhodococcus rhodnii]